MSIKGKINSQKLSSIGSLAQFSIGVRDFLPSANNCIVANITDQYGRFSGPGALNTVTQPGCWSPQVLILNENALRPALASNPLYRNIAADIGFGGSSTMFGLKNPAPFMDSVNFKPNYSTDPECAYGANVRQFYDLGYARDSKKCMNPSVLNSFVGDSLTARTSDAIGYNLR
jgi:hypothetical protein